MTEPNTRHAAKYDAEQTRASDVLALQLVESLGLMPELVATVRAMTPGAGDVQSLAFLTAGRMLAGDKQRNVSRAVRVGVKQARAMQTVYAAREYVASETVQAFWEPPISEADDYLGERTTDRVRGSGLSPMTAPAADAWLNVTRRDVATDAFHVFCDSHDVKRDGARVVAVLCRATSPHAAVWQDSLRAYMRHACDACTGRGRRPSLNGILAHTRGIPSGHSDAWALRRLVNRAADVAAPALAELWREYVGADTRAPRVWTTDVLMVALARARRDAERRDAERRDTIARRAPLTRHGYASWNVAETVQVTIPARPAEPVWESRRNDWTGAERRAWDMLAHDVSAEIAWESAWEADARGEYVAPDAWRAALRATLPVDRVAELPRGIMGNGRDGMPDTIAPRLASPAVRAELPRTGRAVVGMRPAEPARVVQVTRSAERVIRHDVPMPAHDETVTGTYAPDVSRVTVTTRNGETYTRDMRGACESCAACVAGRACPKSEIAATERVRVNEARYDGEAYGETSGRTNTPDARGNVASRKPPVPRKRGTRGATGSVVSAGMPARSSERVTGKRARPDAR